ncbi:hypothetical protein Tco_0985593, partial [Tanacetum coccineum]
TTGSRSKSGEGIRKSPNTHVKAITSSEGCSESPKWTKAKCKRAKQKALFNYEGGLREHYRRLWDVVLVVERGRGSGQRGRGSGQRGRGQMQRDETQESVAANMSDMGERGFRLGDIKAEDNYSSNAELGIPSVDPIEAVTLTANKGKQVAEPSEQHDLQPLPKNKG